MPPLSIIQPIVLNKWMGALGALQLKGKKLQKMPKLVQKSYSIVLNKWMGALGALQLKGKK